MKEKETLVIEYEELKAILAKHYFRVDYQTKEDCYKTTSLGIKFESEEIDHRKIQFILRYEKKIDSFKQPIRKEYVITKTEVIDIINKTLLPEAYITDNFNCDITYGMNRCKEDSLNFITLNLKKKSKVKQKSLGGNKNV